jgi:hypothetical protein
VVWERSVFQKTKALFAMPGNAPERKSNGRRNIVPPLKLMPPDEKDPAEPSMKPPKSQWQAGEDKQTLPANGLM